MRDIMGRFSIRLAVTFLGALLCATPAARASSILDATPYVIYSENYAGETGYPTHPEFDHYGLGGMQDFVLAPPGATSSSTFMPQAGAIQTSVTSLVPSDYPSNPNALLSTFRGSALLVPTGVQQGTSFGLRVDFDGLSQMLTTTGQVAPYQSTAAGRFELGGALLFGSLPNPLVVSAGFHRIRIISPTNGVNDFGFETDDGASGQAQQAVSLNPSDVLPIFPAGGSHPFEIQVLEDGVSGTASGSLIVNGQLLATDTLALPSAFAGQPLVGFVQYILVDSVDTTFDAGVPGSTFIYGSGDTATVNFIDPQLFSNYPIPEPSSLLLAGVAAAGLVRRRRRAAA
jgi:hypothetical protein